MSLLKNIKKKKQKIIFIPLCTFLGLTALFLVGSLFFFSLTKLIFGGKIPPVCPRLTLCTTELLLVFPEDET